MSMIIKRIYDIRYELRRGQISTITWKLDITVTIAWLRWTLNIAWLKSSTVQFY